MKAKKNWWIPGLLGITLLLGGCKGFFHDDEFCISGEGPVVTQTLVVPPFEGIDFQIAGKVYLRQGETRRVEVRSHENIIDQIETDVDDGIWEIEFDRCVRQFDDLEVYITVPQLSYVKLSGSGNIYGETAFLANDMFVRLSGSGNIDLEVDAENTYAEISGAGNIDLDLQGSYLKSTISGSGNINVAGSVVSQELRILGSGNFNGLGLYSEAADITIAGSGTASVYVENSLDVRITGSGDVRYKGTPGIQVDITGSGRVYRIE